MTFLVTLLISVYHSLLFKSLYPENYALTYIQSYSSWRVETLRCLPAPSIWLSICNTIMLFTQLMITEAPFCLPVGANCTVSTPLVWIMHVSLCMYVVYVCNVCVSCVCRALLNSTLYSFDNFYNKNFFGSTFEKVLLAYDYQGLEHIFKKIKFVKCA